MRGTTLREREMRKHAETLQGADMATAIYADVVAGKITSAVAIQRLMQHRQTVGQQSVSEFNTIIYLVEKLKAGDYLTDAEAANYVKQNIKGLKPPEEVVAAKLPSPWDDEDFDGEDN